MKPGCLFRPNIASNWEFLACLGAVWEQKTNPGHKMPVENVFPYFPNYFNQVTQIHSCLLGELVQNLLPSIAKSCFKDLAFNENSKHIFFWLCETLPIQESEIRSNNLWSLVDEIPPKKRQVAKGSPRLIKSSPSCYSSIYLSRKKIHFDNQGKPIARKFPSLAARKLTVKVSRVRKKLTKVLESSCRSHNHTLWLPCPARSDKWFKITTRQLQRSQIKEKNKKKSQDCRRNISRLFFRCICNWMLFNIHAPVLVLDHVPLLCVRPSPCNTVYSASSGPVLLCRNGKGDIHHHIGIHLWCCTSMACICLGCEAPASQKQAKASCPSVARDGSSLTGLKYLSPQCQSLTGPVGNQRDPSSSGTLIASVQWVCDPSCTWRLI